MNLQSTFDIAEICASNGIRQAIISPGSRNAALTIAFARHHAIACYSVPDERSAAFIGLGMSLQTDLPTVLICTSGSAGLNYYPAIAEAFFNQIPLLVLTADRPPELINKRDGQTIFQQNMFGKHVKAYFDFPSLEEKKIDECRKMVQQAISICSHQSKGPVHINIPFREPFYPDSNTTFEYQSNFEIKSISDPIGNEAEHIDVEEYSKILIVAGQGKHDKELIQTLSILSAGHHIPVIADSISNLHEVEGVISHQDLILKSNDDDQFKPELIVTIGLSVLSKNLKIFLKKSQAKHWHIGPNNDAADTFGLLEKSIIAEPTPVFKSLIKKLKHDKQRNEYHKVWKRANDLFYQLKIETDDFNELYSYNELLNKIPDHMDLHLANSLAVRYVNALGVKSKINIYCNRGTSGIDGTNSTAIGSSIISNNPTLLVSGDMAFLYDRNAFWHNHVPENFKIIVFNNHGGGIFRMIDGPSKQSELKEYFETNQQSSAIHVAQEFGFNYLKCDNKASLKKGLKQLLENDSNKVLLEIFTHSIDNKKAFQDLFRNYGELIKNDH